MLYLKTSSVILQTFTCRDFNDGGRVLGRDYTKDCDSDEYKYYRAWAVIGVFIYPLGIPALFGLLMFKNKATIHNSINVQKYGFIFKDYGTIFFAWEIWDLFRKLTMSGLLVFFDQGSADQITIAILFSTIALLAHSRAFPFKDMAANRIQLVLPGVQHSNNGTRDTHTLAHAHTHAHTLCHPIKTAAVECPKHEPSLVRRLTRGHLPSPDPRWCCSVSWARCSAPSCSRWRHASGSTPCLPHAH